MNDSVWHHNASPALIPHTPVGGEGQRPCGLVDSPEMSGPHVHKGRAGLIHHDPFGLIGLTNDKCQDHHWMGLTLH